MKKVLILTTSTGQGHNHAANALCELLKKNGFKYAKHDFLEGSSKLLTNAIIGGYELSATRFSHIYGLSYVLTNNKFINPISTIPFHFVIKRIQAIIDKEKPNLIITTHPISVSILDNLKKHGLNIPIISVVTDFKPHYTYISKRLDAYITGSEYTKEWLVKKGIEKSRVYPLGIPINSCFFLKDKNIDILKRDTYFNILLMSGSMGLKNISYVLQELLYNEHKLRITVVCGNNKSLKESLDELSINSYKNKKLHIVGFSTDIATFMEYSDVLISKPGGLTVTEAIAKNLPLIIPFAIYGQETENTKFLCENGYAIKAKSISSINPIVNNLIENEDKLQNMREKLASLANTYSGDKIIELSNRLIKEYENK